jgi:hypothetical protein
MGRYLDLVHDLANTENSEVPARDTSDQGDRTRSSRRLSSLMSLLSRPDSVMTEGPETEAFPSFVPGLAPPHTEVEATAAAPLIQAFSSASTIATKATKATELIQDARCDVEEERAAIIEHDGGAVREGQGTPSEPTVLAPGNWFDRFGPPGEPSFDQPRPSRRGLMERRGAVFLHFCVTCGAWGAFGYDVVGDRPGRWYCREHRPKPEP